MVSTDLTLYNFILNKTRKVLINNNFTEVRKPTLWGGQKYFWQESSHLNIEIVNAESIMQDCQLIKMLDNIFNHELNLENYVLKINFLGCVQDKKNKNLCEKCKKEWAEFQDVLQILSVNFIIDPMLGIDSDYSKTVFEFCSPENLSNEIEAEYAFAVGGIYNLIKKPNIKNNLECAGAKINTEKIEILLQGIKDKLNLSQSPALNLIVPILKEQQILALLLANDLYFNNICTDILFYENNSEYNIDSIMHKANKMGAKFVLILGEQELEENTVTIKNMQTGQMSVIKQVEAAKFLKRFF
ncbi:MAG: His/Gly/Thr/Pro-type tRNA ligase C-terminal domain-containing protein [Candidatus Babeliales bacterium]